MKKNEFRILFGEDPKSFKIEGAVYIYVQPDQKITDEWSYKNHPSLSGSVKYFNFNGGLIDGYNYRDGKVVKRIKPISLEQFQKSNSNLKNKSNKINNIQNLKNTNSTSSSSCSGWARVINKYCVSVYEFESCEMRDMGTIFYDNCDYPDHLITEETTIDFIMPEGGGGLPSIIIDCNGVLSGSAVFNEDCSTCILGNTGITSCLDIYNKVTDPCLQDIVKTALESKVDTAISKIIKTLDTDALVKINIYDAPSLLSGRPAQNQVNRWDTTRTPMTFSTEIVFNRSFTDLYSKEYVAALLIHEVLHAHFNRYDPITRDTKLNEHHAEFGNKYLYPIANFLNKTYQTPIIDGLALSWFFINETANLNDPPVTYTINGVNYTNHQFYNIASGHALSAHIDDRRGTPKCP